MNDTGIKLDNIFVVIDPTSEQQRALNKAVDLARHYGSGIHVYLCIYSGLETDDPEMLKRVETARYRLWLDTYLEPIRKEGINVEVQIDWTPGWREALRDAALNADCDLIIKPTTRARQRGIRMTSSDMMLFESSHSRILLTSPREHAPTYRILAAVDPSRDGARYKKLFDSVMKVSRHIEAAHTGKGAELHVVYAYSDQDHYMHVTEVANATGVEASRVHVVGGRPEEAIEKVAGDLDAYLVIIGTSTGSAVTNRVFGATTDWILNNVHYDILVIME